MEYVAPVLRPILRKEGKSQRQNPRSIPRGAMESVGTFMIVLIMKLMPQIKLCVIYKHRAITYKNTMIEVICI